MKHISGSQVMEILDKIQSLEAKHYPQDMWAFNAIQDMDGIGRMIEKANTPWVVMGDQDEWYCFLAVSAYTIEVVDLCGKMSLHDINDLVYSVYEAAGLDHEVRFDARQKTAYRIFRYVQKRYDVVMLSETERVWCGETFHSIHCAFQR